MRVSGFSFIRNGIRFDYPFVESVSSVLPLCDEFILAVGQSEDATLERSRGISPGKVRIVETSWDDALRVGGTVLSQQTNIALDHVTGDWAIYLQADEVIHEDDLETIRQAMLRYRDDPAVEGILFPYLHFFGDYGHVGHSRRWYRREIRVVRTGIGVRSWKDAQGFRIGDRKLRVREIPARIFHYGWVKPPAKQQDKQRSFHRLWHSDEWIRANVPSVEEYDYSRGGRLSVFPGTHPSVMKDRIARQNWRFVYDASTLRRPVKERVLDWLEDVSGIRVGEYRNYHLLRD